MKQSLELVTSIGTDGVDAKGELLDHVVYEVYGVLLSIAFVDLQGSNPGGIVNGGVLETPDLLPFGALESKKGHINLDVVARYLLGVATGVNCPTTDVLR